ncbi:GGDEF domain-containing protein [Vibrio rumoiensis]|uniref:GGDEF domain-containing protein n=1 Tax=Vibrio rumoiensis TaxID=76258 RepID=UPI003AA8C6F5
MERLTDESSNAYLYLLFTFILCWLAYTSVTIFNYAESVVSDMKNNLSQYYTSNEKIATHLSDILLKLEDSKDANQNLQLDEIKALDIQGFNISPGQFSEYAGALVAQGDMQKLPFNLSLFLHELDLSWAEEDNNAPGAFFTYYGEGSEFAYTKSRLILKSQPPEISPARYRKDDIPFDYKPSLMTALERSYPQGRSIVILVTPVILNGQLIGDLGVRLKLEKQMLDSLGPWLSQYMALDIEFRDQKFSFGEDRFLPQLFFKQEKFNNITITAYMKTDYITEYILPWFLSMCFIMGMVYFLLNKHKKAAIRFSSLSKTDELTGLFNKRILDEIDKMGISQGTLFYLDVNDFKEINDNYGHYTGDNALRHIASGIRYCMSASDLCIRLGGDEFLIVMSTRIQQPEKVKDKLHQAISGSTFTGDITLTVSIGYSYFDDLGALTQSIHQADKQMYEEKHRYRSTEPKPTVL